MLRLCNPMTNTDLKLDGRHFSLLNLKGCFIHCLLLAEMLVDRLNCQHRRLVGRRDYLVRVNVGHDACLPKSHLYFNIYFLKNDSNFRECHALMFL